MENDKKLNLLSYGCLEIHGRNWIRACSCVTVGELRLFYKKMKILRFNIWIFFLVAHFLGKQTEH